MVLKPWQISAGKNLAQEFVESDGNDRGQASAMRVVSLIVALTVGAIVAAFLLPIGLTELAGSGLGDNASSGASSLWNILDVIIVLAVFLFFIGIALKGADKL